jgi:choline-sulfatase
MRWRTMAFLFRASSLAVALCGLLSACSRSAVDPQANVVVITLDTTRADRLSPYGYMDASMPALERLAREGVVFDRAMTVAPLTLPAHTSLFTGLFPPHHGVRDNADRALASSQTTLAETLRASRFRTGAFVSSVVLASDRGLAQGFEHYVDVPTSDDRRPRQLQRRGDEVMDDAIRWVDEVRSAPFFLWVHLYDAHRPYDPPEPYRSRHFDPYVGEIAFADAQIGRLLDHLRVHGLLERTIVIVAGDHGESLGEHGEENHGIFVYENVLRVPLIVRLPALLRSRSVVPRRVSDIVRLVDVTPTVLDLLGLTPPSSNADRPIDGVSLLSRMRGSPQTSELEAYAESLYPARFGWSPLKTLQDGRFKLIDAPRPELYDLERDPFEERNIHTERPTVADAMRRRLAQMANESEAPDGLAPADELSPDARERLHALGYIGSQPLAASHPGDDRPDPKDCIGRHQKLSFTGSRTSALHHRAEFRNCEEFR